MKIAMIFFSLNVPGGSVSVFLSLANELQRQGHTIDIYAYYWDKANCFPDLTKDLDIHCIQLINHQKEKINTSNIWNRFTFGIDYYINSKRIYDLMQLSKKKYDVIYASEACSYVPALLFKEKFGTPIIWSVFDPISLVDDKRPGLLIHKYKWFKYLLQIHNYFDAANIRRIDGVVVPTRKMKNQLDVFYGVNSIVLPTAGVRSINISKDYTANAKKRLPNYIIQKENIKEYCFIFSNGHFLPHRRYEDTLEAVSQLIKEKEKVIFVITGSSEFDPKYFYFLQNQIDKLHINDFAFLDDGYKTNNELYGYYQLSDVFTFVSVEQTWGLAPFEAMQFGKPVIISDGVGCSEVLKDRENALVVKSRDSRSIYQAVLYMIKNKGFTEKLGKNGQSFVNDNFTYETIAKQLIKYLKTFAVK